MLPVLCGEVVEDEELLLGTDPAGDVLVYEETDERFRVGVWRTLSDAFIVLGLESLTTTELRFVHAN